MPQITIGISADGRDLEREIANAEILVRNLRADVAREFRLGNIDVAEQMQVEVNQARNSLRGLQTELANTTRSTNTLGGATANGGNALMQFSRIAQDAPFGIMGIGNNITATAEAFGHLQRSTGSTGGALRAVASSIMGSGGILLAVSLVTSALTYMSQNGITLGDVIDRLRGKMEDMSKKDLAKAFESDKVLEATKNVSDLTNEIQLAKDGFISKEGVLKHYNETIGKTTGVVNDLDKAEQQLVKNGDAYIKMTLFKAAANIAAEDAAKQSLEAERSRQKKLKEFASVGDDIQYGGVGAVTGAAVSRERIEKDDAAWQKIKIANQRKRKQEEVQVNLDAAQKNLDIAKNFNAQAAAIAKDFKFNFFGDNKVEKTKKEPKVKRPKIESVNELGSYDPDKAYKQGKKELQLYYDAFGNASEDFKNNPIKLDIPIQPTITGFEYITKEMQAFNDSANSLIKGAITDTFVSLGDSIGNALNGAGTGIESAGGAVLGILGNFMSEYGKLMISTGVGLVIADMALKSGNPYAMIAGGVALVAVGAAFSSKSKSMQSSGTTGGGSVSKNSGGSQQSSTSNYGGSSSGMSSGGTVVFEISGNKLIGVLKNTLDSNSRLGGSLQL